MSTRAWAAVLALCAAAPAAADDDEVKLLVQGDQLVPDRPLPASRSFAVQHALPPDVSRGSGYLELWPKLNDACEAVRPDIRQSHSIALTLAQVDGRPTLVGRVPALQVDLEYCLQLHTHLGLSSGQLGAVAARSTAALRGKMLGSGTACADAQPADFEVALTSALADSKLQADHVSEAAAAAHAEFVAKVGDACSRLFEVDKLNLEKRKLGEAALARHEAEKAIDAFAEKLNPFASPLVLLDKAPVPAETLLAAGADPAKQRDAAAQLRARYPDWAEALGGVKKGKLTAPADLELWDGEGFVKAADLPRRDPAITDMAIKILRLAPKSAANAKLLALFERARDRRLDIEAAEKRIGEGEVAAAKLKEDLSKALVAAFSVSGVAHALRSPDRPAFTAPATAGLGETPNKLNYASVDLGILAAPTGFAVWFLPYAGLNVYLVAVDRTIGLHRLSGSWLRRALQVLSVTLGATLAAPGAPGYSVQAPFLSTYPLVGVGARVANFVRISGGALFYVLGDADGLSQRKSLNASFFFGASLDLDLVELLTKVAG